MLVPVLMMLLQAVPVPTFSVQVHIVGVTVSVTDTRTGRPVVGLTPEDFQVMEDNHRQEVTFFEQEEVPASVLILLDGSTSMRGLLPRVRDAAAQLIRRLRPIDEVQVAAFDDHYRLLCDFTTDHEMAVRALSGMRQGDETALNWAIYTATRFLERRDEGNIERKRVLILLSDAENTHDSMSYASALDALHHSSVVLYVVHLQRRLAGDGGRLDTLAETARRFVEEAVYDTGGRLVTVPYPYEDYVIAGAFSDISTELGAQYHLAYASSSDPDKAGWRSISIASTRRIGLSLRYRKGYAVAPRR